MENFILKYGVIKFVDLESADIFLYNDDNNK